MGQKFSSNQSNTSTQPNQQNVEQLQQTTKDDTYNDDEALPVNNEQNQKVDKQKMEELAKSIDINNILKLTVKSMTKAFKLSSTQTQTIPVMVSINTKQEEEKEKVKFDLKNRPSIDLVCVIDQSGSMSGEKIKLVRETLKYLVDLMGENDRLSLILFESTASRLCPLLRVTSKNKSHFTKIISTITDKGGTSIHAGMQLAFKTLKERKMKNKINSIFLLSDGLDGGAESRVDQEIKSQALSDPFTIHTFGFGADHDPKMMNAIAKLKDGNFYYVEKLNQVDEMFTDALGGLFSIIGQNLSLKVSINKQSKTFSDVMVSKTFGDLWKVTEANKIYTVNLIQLLFGISKEFMLELQIPPINASIQDNERNAVFLKAQLNVTSVGDQQKEIQKESCLEMTIYNENENIPKGVNDEGVQANYLRVQAADAMLQCQKLADQGNYQKGQEVLIGIQQKICSSDQPLQQQLKLISRDLEEQKQNCNAQLYEKQGKQKIICQQRAHMEQRSCQPLQQEEKLEYQACYANCIQEQMVDQLQCIKKSKK